MNGICGIRWRWVLSCVYMCKAFNLDDIWGLLRRTLPYASMPCSFRTIIALSYVSMDKAFNLLRKKLIGPVQG